MEQKAVDMGGEAVSLDIGAVAALIAEHKAARRPGLEVLWRYYRNPIELTRKGVHSKSRRGQAVGLPARLTGLGGAQGLGGVSGLAGGLGFDDRVASREIVIENDIAWRIHTMVDFIFGKPIRVRSTARDASKRAQIDRMLDAVWEGSGGVSLLQDMALLGHVYGHVDLVLRVDEGRLEEMGAAQADPWLVGRAMTVEVIEPTRGVPIVSKTDCREFDGYVIYADGDGSEQNNSRDAQSCARESLLQRFGFGKLGLGLGRMHGPESHEKISGVVEVFGATDRWVYVDGELVESQRLGYSGGRVPIVHIQNLAQPFRYAGLSEVEALVPLQDELNTRLSDRASRVTMQSFKMYLAKGIEGFDAVPVGPGQVWSTDNPDAGISSFGGDASSPSEESHIKEVRDAFDKVSGVPPLATGVVQGRVGNLSSSNALKITLVGLLAKTERKRVSYGRGLSEMSRMMLVAFDAAGVLETDPRDRGIRIEWADPLPVDVADETLAAKRKVELGVPSVRVLDELGYEPTDPGIG